MKILTLWKKIRFCYHSDKCVFLHLHFVIRESISINAMRIWCGWLNRGSSRYKVIIIAPWRAPCENLRSPRDTRALWRDSLKIVSKTASRERMLANRYSLICFGCFWNLRHFDGRIYLINRKKEKINNLKHRMFHVCLLHYNFLLY